MPPTETTPSEAPSPRGLFGLIQRKPWLLIVAGIVMFFGSWIVFFAIALGGNPLDANRNPVTANQEISEDTEATAPESESAAAADHTGTEEDATAPAP